MNEFELNYKLIGDFIGTVRKTMGIKKAKDFAAMIGVSPSLVTCWEKGDKRPSLKEYAIIAGIFGITLDELLNAKTKYDEMTSEKYINMRNERLSLNKMNDKLKKMIINEYITLKNKLKDSIKEICNYENVDNDKFMLLLDNFILDKIEFGINSKFTHRANLRSNDNYNFDTSDDIIPLVTIDFNSFKALTKERLLGEVIETFGNLPTDNDLFNILDGAYGILYVSIDDKITETEWYGSNTFTREDLVDKLNDFIGKYSRRKSKLILDELLFVKEQRIDNLSDIAQLLLFNKDYFYLLGKFIDSCSSVEKEFLLKEYFKECHHKKYNTRTDVLRTFLSCDTKYISSYNFSKITYDYEKSFDLLKNVLDSVSNEQEYVFFDNIEYFYS